MCRRAQLLQVGFLVGGEHVRGGDGAGFGEAIDGCIGAGRDEGFENLGVFGGERVVESMKGEKGNKKGGIEDIYLLLIIEAHLARCHTGILVQVGPGRVDDRHIILFVAYRFPSSSSTTKPL